MDPETSDFSDLLYEAEKLTNDIEGTPDLPKVDRSLRQVLEASNELYTRVTQTGAQDIQANLLLGSKGIDLPLIEQKLESISAKKTFEALDPVADNDVDSFLRNSIQNCILSVLEDVHTKTMGDINEQTWEHVQSDWKQEKRKILNAMIGPSENFLDLKRMSQTFSLPESEGISILSNQEFAYARQVAEYNKLIVRGAINASLPELFSKVAEEFKDSKVNDIWEIMKYMLNIPPFTKKEDPVAMRSLPRTKEALVRQAKKYLEERYKTYMDSVVNDNLQQAKRGGLPGTYPLVRSFVGIRVPTDSLGLRDGIVDERPLWPMVYYCLRCGDLVAALHCARKAGAGMDEVIAVLEERIRCSDQKKVTELETKIKFLYRQHVRNSTDPYKRLVFCVLGCCDVSDEHGEVAKTADDYLWLKLSLVRDEDETEEHVNYTELQRMILEEYGEAHYEAHLQPHLYFQVLALTGQFEAAIEFLSRIERYRPHAVHIAIAINEQHMLGLPRDASAPLLSVDVEDPVPLRRLNIARLIMIYVKKFELTNPSESIQYFFVLRNLFDSEKRNLFKVCVCDLAVEIRNYDVLFGRIQPNGVRTRGLVDGFTNVNMTTEGIAEMVAEQLSRKGLFEDAIKLYDLAGNQEDVLSLVCTLLSQVVTQPPKIGSVRERLQVLCQELTSRYTAQGFKCSAATAASFTVLRDLMVFFDQYYNNQQFSFNLAMETLRKSHLVPFDLKEVDECVGNFKRASPEVCKVVPDILLAAMNILYEQYKRLKSSEVSSSRFDNSEIDKQLSYVREQAKALTNFAGSVPYRMPGDTNSKLVQIEILMH